MRLCFLYSTIFLLLQPIFAARVDSDMIDQHKKKINFMIHSRTRIHDGLFYGCAGLAGIALLYTLYKKISPTYFVLSPSCEEYGHILNDLIKFKNDMKNLESDTSFVYKGARWLAQTGSSMLVQSMILRMLEPMYSRIKHIIIADVHMVIKNFWFLAESPTHGRSTNSVAMLKKDIAYFIMHIEGLNIAYKDHNVTLLHDSTAYILAHLACVSERMRLYDKYRVEKVMHELEALFESLLNDAHAHVCSDVLLNDIIRCLRQLHMVNYYIELN